MIEFLVELVGEFLLQLVLEALAELGLHTLKEPFNRRPNPWLAGTGYVLFGMLAGGISLWLLPDHLVRGEALRVVNLVVTPLGAGLMMCLLGSWRMRRGDTLLRIDRFAYGYLFALSLGLVRFLFAH